MSKTYKPGHEKGGIKGSRKGIKHGNAGRQLSETEHNERMQNVVGTHPAYSNYSNNPDSEGISEQ